MSAAPRRDRPPSQSPARHVVQARISAELHAALDAAARRSGRSRSDLVVAALERLLALDLPGAALLRSGEGLPPPLLTKLRMLAAAGGVSVEEYIAAALSAAVERDYAGLFEEAAGQE